MTPLVGCQMRKTDIETVLKRTHSQDKANDVEGSHIDLDLDILVISET